MTDVGDFSNIQQKFLEFLKSQNRAHATILAYGKDIEQLLEFVGEKGKKDVREIGKNDLESFLKSLNKNSYTAKSISRKLNSIKTFYRYLRATGKVREDPTTDIPHPKYEIKPPRVLSKLEYRALRDACRDDIRISTIVELLLQTGVRIGELSRIKIEDIDLENNKLHIRAYGSYDDRSVPLNRAAKQAVKQYLKIRPQGRDSTLFITKTGRPLLIRNMRTAIDRYFRLAGIEDVKVNDLRHTFIAHHLMRGTPLTLISKLVGHKRLSTTEKYLEIVKNRRHEENVKLGEL